MQEKTSQNRAARDFVKFSLALCAPQARVMVDFLCYNMNSQIKHNQLTEKGSVGWTPL